MKQDTHVLDQATQALITSIEIKDARFRRYLLVFWTLLFLIAIVGIYNQNALANKSKQHIDCIVKLLASPDRQSKVITDPYGSCNIKFQ